MPRRTVLTAAERASLFVLPDSSVEMARLFAFGDSDVSAICRRRGDANRLGFAVQMCLLRYPGTGLLANAGPSTRLVEWVGRQFDIDPRTWARYAGRDATRREHLLELREYLGLRSIGAAERRRLVTAVADVALRTDKGVVLARHALDVLRREHIIVPTIAVVERVCAEAVTRANRRIYTTLSKPLTDLHRDILELLLRGKSKKNVTWLTWLRQPPLKTNSRQMIEHIKRLKVLQAIDLPAGIERSVHQNRLLNIAREGAQMTPANLTHLEPERRYATLVAMLVEATATVTDEIVDLHDRILGKLFNAARNRHQQQFQQSGKAINEKVNLFSKIGLALVRARERGEDPYDAIESVIPWKDFAESVLEAEELAQPEGFDYLHRIGDNYATIRRYAPDLLDVLKLRATPAAQGLLDALDILRTMNADGARKVPPDAPTDFIKRRWHSVVVENDSIDRRYYELCVLAEMRNALRSGDIWVEGSRQFKAFDEYLVPAASFADLKDADSLEVAIATDRDAYPDDRLEMLERQLARVNRMAKADKLPDAAITSAGLKITPLDSAVPDEAQALIERTARMLPHVKITELLMEVDTWTSFSRHFTHLKSGEPARDPTAVLTAILADAINLGLTKMVESCPGATYNKLAWLQSWHIRDETYSAALAELVNAQLRQGFAAHWGDGTTSSSDGQRFRAGGKGESTGHVNPKYGSEPGRLFYTHISDQYSPFSVKVVNVGVRDSTYVLDGLLYHESDLRIEEHYTDTAGFTDHVFALMQLLGFRFAPRIRDLGDTKLYVPR
ncbi:MAG TPA: Tn3 family transposase, partial [Blastocatellia bacterium]|nr:Tn3 family transposase [Blastocatellia bacterium]